LPKSARNSLGLIAALTDNLRDDVFWSTHFRERVEHERSDWALHVAVFREPYLTWVLDGRKRVESRFSQNQVVPFGEVNVGDIVALKRVGGPIVGICLVNATWSYRLDPATWPEIRERFGSLICADDEEFWLSRKAARFATLISLDHVRGVEDIDYPKSDRRGWVVERGRIVQQSLDL